MEKASAVIRKAFLAGVMIGVGGTVCLSCANPVVGALLFSIGLMVICIFGFNLFTGKIGFVSDAASAREAALTWLGNLLGTVFTGVVIRYARPAIGQAKREAFAAYEYSDLLRIFILALFCGMLMYIAVKNFKTNSSDLGKYLGIVLCVSVFILCKFEHCIADMFYFALTVSSLGEALKAAILLIVITLGNSAGALCFRALSDKK